jgi:FkbM family methyltransferase
MQNLSDTLPPAPASTLTSTMRVVSIGGAHHLVNARHGGFLANENDFYLGYALMRYGEYGEIEWHLLQQLIRTGNTVVEVGANIGTHTVPMAKAVGVSGRVIAVEPQRVIHQYLCANVAFNSLPNVETYHAGCGERVGIMAVPLVNYHASQRNNFGGISLVPEGNGEPVSIRPLDDIVGTRPVQLIKIDVEGMEAEVLRGAKKTIRKHRPFLYVENDRQDKSEDLIKLIHHYQYRAFWHLPPLYNPMNFFEQTENIYQGIRSVNLFCIPADSTMNMSNFQEATDPAYHPLRK